MLFRLPVAYEVDGGIRMNNQAITFNVLKERPLRDTSFPDAAPKSKIYDCIFKKANTEVEFQQFGATTCDIPIFEFLGL